MAEQKDFELFSHEHTKITLTAERPSIKRLEPSNKKKDSTSKDVMKKLNKILFDIIKSQTLQVGKLQPGEQLHYTSSSTGVRVLSPASGLGAWHQEEESRAFGFDV